MKKFLIFLLLILTTLTPVTVYGSSLSFTKGTVNKSGEIIEGVSYENFSAQTTTDYGTVGEQNISYVMANAGSDIEIVTWAKTTTNYIVGANLLLLAQDFEINNPEYVVLAGINGDYYNMSTFETVNAHVHQGVTIKSQNFGLDRYFSVGFTNDEQLFIANKQNEVESYYSLTISDNGRVYKEIEIQGFNQIPGPNQTSVYYNLLNIPTIDDVDIFSVGIKKAINYGTYYLDGTIIKAEDVIVSDNQYFSIVTKDSTVLDYLQAGYDVTIQKYMDGVYQGVDSIIGVGSQPLEDGVIKAFEDINDQNVSFAEARHPRSSFGFTPDGDFILLTIDGRQVDMDGANLREVSKVMQSLGANQAFNLDGGGSTQLIVREGDELVRLNSPSEIRRVANAIFIVAPKVKVTNEVSNVTYDSFDFSYNVEDNIGTVIDYRVYLDDQLIDDTTNSLSFSDLTKGEIYYLSVEVDYQIGEDVYTNIFLNKRVNLKPYEGDYVEQPPSNFWLDITNNESISGFEIFVTYDDPDQTLTKMYLLYDDKTEIISKSVGGYKILIPNAEIDKNYAFKIEYYYRIDTITPVSEITGATYYYRYSPLIEDEDDTTTTTNTTTEQEAIVIPPEPEENGFDYVSLIYSGVGFLAIVIFIIIRRKK